MTIIGNSMNVKNIASKFLGSDLFKIIATLIFNPMKFIKNYRIGEAKNDTIIEQVRYEN